MAENFTDELIRTIKPKPEKNRTHSAIVSKVDSDGVAWVYVAGSDQETPIASAASEIKRGDAVNVEWRNNKLYIAGNYSNPSAGVTRVTNVENAAQVANQLAGQASESAAVAQDAADRAVRDADTAHQAANTAQASADRSLVQLSIVEDVAGTLNWISEHGEYVATTDTQVDPDKVYFELVDGDYVPIANPDPEANPAESGWYILDVTDSQSDYIMAHMAVTSAGLWVLPSGQWAMHPLTDSDGDYLINSDGDYVSDWSKDPQNASGYKVLLSATGMTVFDGEGVAVASYGAEMVLGRLDSGNLIAKPTGVAVRNGLEELATFGASGSRIGSEAEGEYNLETTSNAINYKVGEIPIIKYITTFTDDSSVLGYSYYQNMMATSNGRAYVMYGSAPDADNDNPTGIKTANASIGVNGGTSHEALVYCGSDAYNGNPAIIATINGVGRVIITDQNVYLYDASNNTLTDLLKQVTVTQSFDLGVISISAGTPGTASPQNGSSVITTNITKSGYTPIAVSPRYVSASVIGLNSFFNADKSAVITQVIRRQSTAASPGYHAYIDVVYIKS